MVKQIQIGETIGIVGGGIIGFQLVLAAKRLGYRVSVLASEDDVAGQSADIHVILGENHAAGLLEIAKHSAVLTYVSDDIYPETLSYLKKEVYMPQGLEALEVAKDKVLEKAFLDNHSINIVPFELAILVSDVPVAAEKVGYPCVVKPICHVEGEKIVVIHSPEDVDRAVPLIQKGPCLVESYVSIKHEWLMTISVNASGDYSLLPVVETKHNAEGQLSYVRADGKWLEINQDVLAQMTIILKVIASELARAGTVSVSFFETEGGNLYVNALTTHLSVTGLYAVDACNFSQFDTHIRAICHQPMPKVNQFISAITFPFDMEELDGLEEIIKSKTNWLYHVARVPYANLKTKHYATVLSDNVEESIQDIYYSGLMVK